MKSTAKELERNVAELGAAVKHLREAVDEMKSTAKFVGVVMIITVTAGVLIAVMATQ